MRQTRALSRLMRDPISQKKSFQLLAISFQPFRGPASNPGVPQEKLKAES
jgi:hypothetical protein